MSARTKNKIKGSNKPVTKTRSKALVNRANISPAEPIPFEQGRAFSYVNQTRYLPFLGAKDDYGQLLIESRLLSDTNNACIVTKKDYCAGSGFQYKDSTKKFNKRTRDWFALINGKGQSATKVSANTLESHFTFGNTPIEVVRFTVNRKRYLWIYVKNFLEWKLCLPNDDDICEEALTSKLFLKQGAYQVFNEEDYKKSRKLPIYNPSKRDKDNWIKVGNTERTLIWYKNEVTGFEHYGLPSNVASLIYQILEYKGARFNLDNLDNNMVVSAILALKGSYTQPEIDKIGKKAISVHVGEGKAGRVMVVGSEEGIDGSDLHKLDTHKEGSYAEADNLWTQKIILANQWDAVLMGLLSNNTLGKGSNFITKILEIKQKTVIEPAQQDLLTNVWKTVFGISNDWLGLDIDIEDVEIRNSIDISGLTDVDITPAVMVDEVRQSKKLPKLEDEKKGKMLLGELKGNQMKGVYVKDKGNNNSGGNNPQQK